MKLDIIVCAYNEEGVLGHFFTVMNKVIANLSDCETRLIFVNDGSKDKTLSVLKQELDSNPYLNIIDLSRNFGHEAALDAGLQYADADAVIVMDADLEDPPELIPTMLEKYKEGFEVVNAQRITRHNDSFFKRWTAKAFYKTINQMSGKIKIPENVGNYRLISRRVLDAVKALPEKNRVFRVLIPFLGFKSLEIPFERPKRPAGQTHYNIKSMTKLAIDGITSATTIPLKFAVNAGFVIAFLGFVYLIYVLVVRIFTNDFEPGWPSTMATILFLGGVQLIFLGVIGEYIGRIFSEVKGRPTHIIQKVYDQSDKKKTG